jgi:hypothetical protein
MKHRPERKWQPGMPGPITSNEFRVPARSQVDPVQPGVDRFLFTAIIAAPTNLQPEQLLA